MKYISEDLRNIWRTARCSPGVMLAVIAMLTLGTGGITTVFNPIYLFFSSSLPFPQSEQLVRIGGKIPILDHYHGRFEKREELGRIFSNLTAYVPYSGSILNSIYIPETGKNKFNTYGLEVAGEFFETLGVNPIRGNIFNRDNEQNGIVISYRLWRDEFNQTDDIIGKIIHVGVIQYIIIGIMPENFDFPGTTDFWVRNDGKQWPLNDSEQILGRLRPVITIGQAAKQLRALKYKPESGVGGRDGPVLQPLKTFLYGDRTSLLLMFGTVAILFLLLVCTGVTNLLVTQGTRRRAEMATRLLLGATRQNLIYTLLRETLPLVVIGALSGLWFSKIANAWLIAKFPILQSGDVDFSAKMMFFSTLILTVTILGGLTPALYATRVDLNTYLKTGTTFKRKFFSLQELLVGVQLALALSLLIGMVLLLRNIMFNVNSPIEWSLNETIVVTAQFPIEMETSSIQRTEAQRRYSIFFQEFKHHLNTIPEVAIAGSFNPIPFSPQAVLNSQVAVRVAIKNLPMKQSAIAYGTTIYVSPEGFEVLGIPFTAGRTFSEANVANRLESQIEFIESRRFRNVGNTAIINQTLAQQFWPGENAVGKTIYDGMSVPHEVIGVVPEFFMGGDKKKVPSTIFVPDIGMQLTQRFLVRLHSASLIKDFRQRLFKLDTGLVHIEMQSLRDYTSDPTANTHLVLQFLGCFTLLGIMVAGLGVYATTTVMAVSRNKEIGIRMAVGAQNGNILRFVLLRGLRPIIIGLPLGLFLAIILSRILASFIVQLNITDLLAWLLSCVVLVGVTTIATFIPTLRAIHLNPLDVLSKE